MITWEPFLIQSIIQETPDTYTIVLQGSMELQPGQFVMVTDFESGEKPFSFSLMDKNICSLTIKAVGAFTKKITSAAPGSTLYIRGPYGNSFPLPDLQQHIILVGGGCGTAPMRLWLHHLLDRGRQNITFINGARTDKDLLYTAELENLPITLFNATDDGSAGFHGFTSSLLADLLAKHHYDVLYTAGPELMMKKIHGIMGNTSTESYFLLERYMKCGVGLCGQCTLDPAGIRICVEGPVISGAALTGMDEFGSYTRDVYGGRKELAGLGCT